MPHQAGCMKAMSLASRTFGDALEGLAKQGKVAVGTRVDLARSRIGMAVRAGSLKPDIASVDAFKRAMLDARSIAYSASASGVYLTTELFLRLGILASPAPAAAIVKSALEPMTP